jgi:hypothetical protein
VLNTRILSCTRRVSKLKPEQKDATSKCLQTPLPRDVPYFKWPFSDPGLLTHDCTEELLAAYHARPSVVPMSNPSSPPRSPTSNIGNESSLLWQSSEEAQTPGRNSQRKAPVATLQSSHSDRAAKAASETAPPLYVRRKRQAANEQPPALEAPFRQQPLEALNAAVPPRKVRLKRSRPSEATSQAPEQQPRSPPKRQRSGPWVAGDTVEEILAQYLVPADVLAMRPVATGQLRDCTDADTPRECGLCGSIYRLIFFKRSPGGKIGYCTRCDRLRSRCSHHKVCNRCYEIRSADMMALEIAVT